MEYCLTRRVRIIRKELSTNLPAAMAAAATEPDQSSFAPGIDDMARRVVMAFLGCRMGRWPIKPIPT